MDTSVKFQVNYLQYDIKYLNHKISNFEVAPLNLRLIIKIDHKSKFLLNIIKEKFGGNVIYIKRQASHCFSSQPNNPVLCLRTVGSHLSERLGEEKMAALAKQPKHINLDFYFTLKTNIYKIL